MGLLKRLALRVSRQLNKAGSHCRYTLVTRPTSLLVNFMGKWKGLGEPGLLDLRVCLTESIEPAGRYGPMDEGRTIVEWRSSVRIRIF
jgi:hypothetical protein